MKRCEGLTADYQVMASFYKTVVNGKTYRLRRVLEIGSDSRGALPDAVVVMMNPGGSEPCDPNESSTNKMVPTHPDDTQCQIMRLMRRVGWKYVRVLNLSDLRNPNSGQFMDEMEGFENDSGPEHSVFSNTRKDELSSFLRRAPHAPIIAAWGCNKRLEPLIKLALSCLCVQVVGRAGGSRRELDLTEKNPELRWRYWHPLLRSAPKQKQWLDDVVQHLNHASSE